MHFSVGWEKGRSISINIDFGPSAVVICPTKKLLKRYFTSLVLLIGQNNFYHKFSTVVFWLFYSSRELKCFFYHFDGPQLKIYSPSLREQVHVNLDRGFFRVEVSIHTWRVLGRFNWSKSELMKDPKIAPPLPENNWWQTTQYLLEVCGTCFQKWKLCQDLSSIRTCRSVHILYKENPQVSEHVDIQEILAGLNSNLIS